MERARAEPGLYREGIREASRAYAFGENIFFAFLVAFGALLLTPFTFAGFPVVSVTYVIFLVVMLGGVLRKHLCTNCHYHDKWCHCGWGKLAAGYEKGSGDLELGGKLALVTWGVLMVVPIVGVVLAALLGLTDLTDMYMIIIPFAAMVAGNLMLHIKDCRECKMRYTCPVSGAKGRLEEGSGGPAHPGGVRRRPKERTRGGRGRGKVRTE